MSTALAPTQLSYFLQAGPNDAVAVDHFFHGAPNALADVMRAQPALRPMGFNLPDGTLPKHTSDQELVITLLGDGLSVSRAGLTTALQSRDHLTHGMRERSAQSEIWINPKALIEFTYEFWRFYLNQVVTRFTRPSASSWKCGMNGLGSPTYAALPDGLGIFATARRSAASRFEAAWSPVTHPKDPDRMAFLTLTEVYASFGRPPEEVLFAVDRRIDEGALLGG